MNEELVGKEDRYWAHKIVSEGIVTYTIHLSFVIITLLKRGIHGKG